MGGVYIDHLSSVSLKIKPKILIWTLNAFSQTIVNYIRIRISTIMNIYKNIGI